MCMRHLISTLTSLAVCFIGSLCAQDASVTPPQVADEVAKIRLVLLPNAPRVDEATQQSVLAWVKDFQNTVYRLRVRDFIAAVDVEKLGTDLLAKSKSPPSAKEKAKMSGAMAMMIQKTFPMLKDFFLFKTAEIRRIEVNGSEAVVLARVRDHEETEMKVRWWLRREGDRWLMTDYEMMSANMRLSVMLAMGPAQKTVGQGFMKMAAAQQEGRFDDLVEIAEELEKEALTPQMREVLLLGKIGALFELGELESLPDESDKLEAVAPEQPMLPYLRATWAYWDEDYAEAVKWLERLGSIMGYDEETWSMLTEALVETGQKDKAIKTAEKWMADYPESALAVWTYWTRLPDDKTRAKRMQPHLERLVVNQSMAEDFVTLAEDDKAARKALWEVAKDKGIAPGTLQESEQAVKDAAEKLIKEMQPKVSPDETKQENPKE
jgi:tetratricopeptide (TPR) repeat protein